jgi:hypothetical protein
MVLSMLSTMLLGTPKMRRGYQRVSINGYGLKILMAPALIPAWAISSGVVFEILTSGPKKPSPDTQDSCGRVFVFANYSLFLWRKSYEKAKTKALGYSSISERGI